MDSLKLYNGGFTFAPFLEVASGSLLSNWLDEICELSLHDMSTLTSLRQMYSNFLSTTGITCDCVVVVACMTRCIMVAPSLPLRRQPTGIVTITCTSSPPPSLSSFFGQRLRQQRRRLRDQPAARPVALSWLPCSSSNMHRFWVVALTNDSSLSRTWPVFTME